MRSFSLIVLCAAVFAVHIVSAAAQSTDCLNVVIMQTDVTEGGSIGYTVALPSSPAPGEVITVSPEGYNTDRVAISPESREFTTENWQLGRVFTLTVPDNDRINPNVMYTRLSHVAVSNQPGSRFNGMEACAPVTLAIRDNDSVEAANLVLPTSTAAPTTAPTLSAPTPTLDRSQPGISFYPTHADVREGGTLIIDVSVLAPPHMNESLTVFPLFDPVVISISPYTRDINFSNWQNATEFVFTAQEDITRQPDRTVIVTFYLTSTDPYSPYFNLTIPAQLTITIQDND